MEITARVHEILPTQVVSEKFQKRELVVEYADNPQYPEFIKLESHGDKCEKLDELKVGDNITVHFNLRGKPWTDKSGKTAYFNSLVVWKFDINQTVAGAPVKNNVASEAQEEDDSDLPF